jgi:hypothetical protein
MRNFLLNSILVLLVSCHKYKPSDSSDRAVPEIKTKFNVPFSRVDTSYLFKTAANIYGHYLSGLLIIKAYSSDDYRLVFTNEMGVKFFDFEFKNKKFIVHHVLSKLNRKPVLNILEKDFRLLLSIGLSQTRIHQVETDSTISISFNIRKEKCIYIFKKPLKTLSQAKVCAGTGKEKVTIYYNNTRNNIPQNIKIEHHNIKLEIELNYLQR